MSNIFRRSFSFLLVAVMLFSLVSGTLPAMEVHAQTNETQQTQTQNTGSNEPDVKIGVLSDIHVSFDYVDETYGAQTGHFNGVQPGRFEKALRFFKSQGVNAIVIAGDLQEAAGTDAATLAKSKVWLQKVVDVWYEVFPEKRGEEGYVESIFTYGNHDSGLVDSQYWPAEWGTYQDVFVKEVNGYSFICTHNAKESLAAPLLEEIVPENEDKPVFYIQHCPVYATVPGSTEGYGTGYGQNGWDNVAPYHNVVVLNGHTHVPLTDERSIWQGDGGNEGQFTVLNTATINYSGLSNDNLSFNTSNGNAQQTEHGMIISVTGSDVSVDRYSFNDMTLDDVNNTISGEADKLGETWAWDACDITDRPYAYDNRVENSAAPEFADDAQITVDSITNTTVQVTVPAASITPKPGFSNMIEGYFLEACNPVTGEVEALGTIATSYHVDDEEGCYAATYTIKVSGLNAGTEYLLKVYAQNFYDVKSNVLTTTVTTSGERTYQRTGDINNDGKINNTDLILLKDAISGDARYSAHFDVDGNGVVESRDVAFLEALLNGTKLTFNSDDLMDKVVEVKFNGGNAVDGSFGSFIQSAVVHGDSNQAVKTWTVMGLGYPYLTMYFDEPVDLSEYTHLSFDAMFENSEIAKDPYAWRWISIFLVSGDQEQQASYGSVNVDANGVGWDTVVFNLASLKNVDLTAVTAIRFQLNFATGTNYDSYYDGVTEHVLYVDNIFGVFDPSNDKDMSANATLVGGQIVNGAGYTSNSNEAIKSTGGQLDVIFDDQFLLSDYAKFSVQMRTPGTYTVNVQALDAEGNAIGTAVTVESWYVYKQKNISIPAMGLAEGTYIKGLRFTYNCEHLLIDTLTTSGAKDTDLIGTSSITVSDGFTWQQTTEKANNSNNSLYVTGEGNVVATLTPETAVNMSNYHYLRLDAMFKNTDAELTVTLIDGEGSQIATYTISDGSYKNNFARYEIDMLKLADADKLMSVAKIQLSTTLNAGGELWVDNLKVVNPVEDFFGAATSLQGPTSVQDDFICEIIPNTADGRTNVLHWYSDPANNSGTTSAWPGDTTVTINKNVIFQNHNGYDASSYDYLEFTMKNVGNYVAFTFSFLDESGATLGSSNGEYRVSLEEEWTTYRIDLASAGLTADEIAKIHTISMGWNWQYQNVNGSETKKVADIYIDNMGFCSYPEDDIDLLDQVGLIRNSEWWWGGHNTYPGAGWLYQSDVTVGSDKAFMFYRSADTNGMGYSPRILYVYFAEAITVESDWVISLDVINENFAKNCRIEIIGSDGKNYTCFTLSNSGSYSLEAVISSLVTSDGVAFDPATVSVKGLKYHTNYNRDSSVSATEGGYLVLDNLTIAAPAVVPEVDLDGADLIGIADSVVMNNASAFEDGFVFETLDSYDERDHVVHMYSDPANGGALINSSSYYYGAVITLSNDAIYNAEGVDFVEFYLKNTNIYCDQVFVEVLDSSGNSLGSVYKRMAMTSDWAYYRLDLATLGLTEEELSSISAIRLYVNWSMQLSTADAPVAGEVYVDDLTFGSYLDESSDLFDHISSVQNVEWWWSGNNVYGNVGWLMETDDIGSRYFTIYRGTEPYDNGIGYTPRRQYMYFDEAITLNENFVVSIDATNTYMGTGTKISLLGDDGKKYGYLRIDQTGTYSYEMAITDFVLLNADTHMTVTETPIDVSTVKIIGVIFHNDFFNGDTTYEGSLVMDNFRIYDPNAEEPTEPETTIPETTVPDSTKPDGGDLLYGAAAADARGFFSGDPYYYDLASTVVNGENSTQSLMFGTTFGSDATSDRWPTAMITLAEPVDLKDKILVLDVYFDIPEGSYAQNLSMSVQDSSWGSCATEIGIYNYTPGWHTLYFDFNTTAVEGKDLSNVCFISLQTSFANVEGEHKMYLDNMRLIDRSEPNRETELESDIIESVRAEWPIADWNGTTNGVLFDCREETNGSKSWNSLKFYNTTGSGAPKLQIHLQNRAFDITGKDLMMDVKFVNATQRIGILLNNGWSQLTNVIYKEGDGSDGWQTITFTAEEIAAASLDGVGTDNIMLMTFYLDFTSNVEGEHAVYVDNVRAVTGESVEDDWVNMSIDTGMNENVEYNLVTENTRPGSQYAMKVVTGEEAGTIAFSPQAAVLNGTLPEKVNMTEGIIGGYFYFGDQTPYVRVRLTCIGWHGGAPLELNYIDAGDGWYYCYIDTNNLYFYADQVAAGANREEIIRVEVQFKANTTVYIDQFLFPAFIPADLVDYRVVYDGDLSNSAAKDVVTKLEANFNVTAAFGADTLDAVANEIIIGSTARNTATVSKYLTGGSNDVGEYGYAVVVEGGKIYLVANTNAGIYQALERLEDLYTTYGSLSDIPAGAYEKPAADTTDNADRAEGSNLRVMSYNILYSTEFLVKDRIGNFLNIIGYYTPDVVGLQEVSGGSSAGWNEFINRTLVRDGLYSFACEYSNADGKMMTTFIYNTKTVKLIDEYVVELTDSVSNIRVLAVAVFEHISNGQRFVVTNTHPTPYGNASYYTEMEVLLVEAAKILDQYSDLPVIMVGDFNTDESDPEYETLKSALGVSDAKYTADTMVREYNTWSGFGVAPIPGSDYCIDHLFHNAYADPILYNIVIDHDVEHTSDHIPQYVDFAIGEVTGEPDSSEPDTTKPETTEPEKDIDLLYAATCPVGTKQSEVTNGSTEAWKLVPTATGWSYPEFTLDKAYDISKYNLVFDIKPTGMTHFRMHVATLDGQWIDGAAVYYTVDQWTTVSVNLANNSKGLTEMTKFSLGIDFGAEGTDYALYIDNVRLVERKVNEDATEETEKASDMMSIATFEWSGSDWSGAGVLSYNKDCDETYGPNSVRSWSFTRADQEAGSYARMQIKLNANYDMSNKDLVFEFKAVSDKEIAPHNLGFILQGSSWESLFLTDNYAEPSFTVSGNEWHTITIDNSILQAYLVEGCSLNAVYLLNFCFSFNGGSEVTYYIDNMRLVDHVEGTDETDAANDLLASATIVENSADDSVYFYEHHNTDVAFGENSNASHKFYATAAGSGYHTVKYDLGKSYDLTGKNIVMDVLAFRCSTTFLFQLYDSENNLITSAYRGCASRKWSEVTPAVLSNDLDLTDVRYIVIGAYFQPDSSLNDRAFYVDNVRIEEIDTYHTDLENKNVVFIGDSITASGGYKGWSGELEEHYFINRYNIGAGGTSYAQITGRGQIFSQTNNIPSGVNVDFFILNGGVNDIWSAIEDLGSVSDIPVATATVNDFDTTTTAGGMEQIFCYLRTNYPNAKIGFVITYNCFDSGFDAVRYRDEFVPLAKAICEKWSVPYLDLVNNDAFNAEFNALPGYHTYDGVHANDVGYDLVMRQMAPWMLSMIPATEASEQNSDLWGYANYEWSNQDWSGEGVLSYDKASTVTYGPYSTRSWKFTTTYEGNQEGMMQIKVPVFSIFDLTGKDLVMDVKLSTTDFTGTPYIKFHFQNSNWKTITSSVVSVNLEKTTEWQTVRFDNATLVSHLADGCTLDSIYLMQIYMGFGNGTGERSIFIDNVRTEGGTATDETEEASDLLHGATYVSGSFDREGFGYDQYCTSYTNGTDSKYSLRMYADTEATAWCNAKFELPEAINLVGKTLQFDVNKYQHVYIGVSVYNSNDELVASDGFTLRADTTWATHEVYLLDGLAEGMTEEDLADIKYINFSSSFETSKVGRVLYVDNVKVYENEQYDTVLDGLNALYLGDSISEAIGYKGWRGELREHYGVNDYNVSASGAVLINNQTHNLHQQLEKAPTGVNYDLIILNGGVNDIWQGHTMGEVSPEGTTEFNVDTTIGALEDLFARLKAAYPNAKICFVLNYTCSSKAYPAEEYEANFVPLARAACEKWGIPYLDLVSNEAFLAEFDVTSKVHTFDGVHANTEGYNIITKHMVPWLIDIVSAS